MSTEIAEPQTTPTGEAATPAQDQQTETSAAPDGAKAGAEAGQDQPTATDTLLTKEQPPVPTVPDTYDLKVPETTYLDPTVTERVTAIAKELGVTDATHAQKVLDAIDGEVVSAVEAYQQGLAKGGALWKATVERLEASALADKEIGGSPEQLHRSVTEAKAVLDKHATPELKAWMEESGQGSHPEFIRFLTRVAKALGEDQMIQGTEPPKRPKSRAEKMYPNLPSA